MGNNVPALGIVAIALALYFNLAEQWDPRAAPVVSLVWCTLGSATVLFAANRMRTIGRKLAIQLQISDET
jgi:hypothetical protein